MIRWSDEAIALAWYPLGEHHGRLSLLTPIHGRRVALVRGGAHAKSQAQAQPGNLLWVAFQARLPEQLGSFTIELRAAYAPRLLARPRPLLALAAACALCDRLLPEQQPYPQLFVQLLDLLESLTDQDEAAALADYARFELLLLAALGYGLDLQRCAQSGQVQDLAFVSPRSGRAISRQAAGAWAPRLLPLPGFLHQAGAAPPAALAEGLSLTGHFLVHHVLPGGLPPVRQQLAAAIARQC